jgi:hypothetical protein
MSDSFRSSCTCDEKPTTSDEFEMFYKIQFSLPSSRFGNIEEKKIE